jgi:hypothetical protein
VEIKKLSKLEKTQLLKSTLNEAPAVVTVSKAVDSPTC